MSLTINIYYTGENGSARKFAEEMVEKGVVDRVRAEKGNKKYEYFFPMEDKETVLLIDRWENQEALDEHHKSPMMKEIADLRDKYHLHMRVEQFVEKNKNFKKSIDRQLLPTYITEGNTETEGTEQSGELLAEKANGGEWLEGHRFRSNPSDSDITSWTDSLK